jgi:xanthosine utilization system XapX-like protein
MIVLGMRQCYVHSKVSMSRPPAPPSLYIRGLVSEYWSSSITTAMTMQVSQPGLSLSSSWASDASKPSILHGLHPNMHEGYQCYGPN